MGLTAPHRILRRLAGRMRLDAMGIDDEEISKTLLLMAWELEERARQIRPSGHRKN